jgi:hypothetical protein
MIKGLQRQVIVVKPEDTELFEEAIFIIRNEVFTKSGANPEQILKEARKAAGEYVKKLNCKRHKNRFSRFTSPFIAVAGAAASGAVWLASRVTGV